MKDAIELILSEARKRGIPVNDTADDRAVGLTVRQETLPVYANRRARRQGVVLAEIPQTELYVTYNCPVDAKGRIIRLGIERVAQTVESICESLGYKVREAPYGVWVEPK